MVSESNEKSYETMVIDIELFLLFCINDSYMFETRSFLSTQWKAVLYIQFIRRLILYVHNGWSEIHFISIFLAKFNKRFTYLNFSMLLFKTPRLIELIEKNSILIFHQDNINYSS